MEKYLICTDIDGTLITSDQQVPPKTLALLQELIAQGHHFAVSTGRMFQSANKFARLVDESGNVICSNGSVVSSGGETLFRQGLDPESIQTVFDICTLHQVPLFFFSENTVFYTMTPPSYITDEAEQGRVDGTKLVHLESQEDVKRHQAEIINAITIEEDLPEKLTAVREALEKVAGIRTLSSHFNNIEILPEGIDKEHAVERLRQHLEVKPEHVIAFGDGENDLQMLRYAGVGVAMGNAADFVKEHASYVTTSNENEGIYEFLKAHIC
ncbi:Sugar phosphatase SupH [Listeria grayi]|uniref:Uncharacterized protein n=1 Tax=Listeria grayi FSL F6-1183 TaxID=1265827 RepID=A0A829R2A3_LISGR|nr:HAD family hydrolase [Listeria grayi]EUJ25657.1 hypothetical protein LMUR_14836 [Listeria grayi FSL F6-1183]MBC1921425.1 Cof-type HAD-IIB family hydrolase [Listeria grayi]VEI35830.1 Sugar phosphatase SupH [Listeria grayi]